ncbi:MAG: hypothetical protein LBQ44_02310 [Treponema sp.]|jgi:hypothetical protein|nr:hypothetical protein [Treponema sp.]
MNKKNPPPGAEDPAGESARKPAVKGRAGGRRAEDKTGAAKGRGAQSGPEHPRRPRREKGPALRPAEGRPPRGVRAAPEMPVLKLVVFILDWSKSRAISEILEESQVRFHFICKGMGTAGSEILDLLGIGSAEKAVVICLEQNVMVPILLKRAAKKLGLHNPGAGIAFTAPLTGINKPMLQVFKESIHKNIRAGETGAGPLKTGKKEQEMSDKTDKRYDLIVIVANQGYSDELMTAAREAGATGGTVMNARGLAHKGPVKFLGISVQDEKEIITILTNRDKKIAIMQAVSRGFGISSKAQGVVFSLPAEDITGLDL